MRTIYIILLFTCISFNGFSQETLWASKVLGFSSEFQYEDNPKLYVSHEILGEPSTMTSLKAPQAIWIPATNNTGKEWIKVAFEKAITARQVCIFETFNMGAITEVWAYQSENDPMGKLIYSNNFPGRRKNLEPLNIFPRKLKFKVKAIKVVLNTKSVTGFNAIDAIAISESEIPLKTEINLSLNFDNIDLKSKLELLPPSINSKEMELLPVITPNGKRLYFVRQVKKDSISDQDIWYADINSDGSFSEAMKIPPPINSDNFNSALMSISPDGQTALLLNKYLPNKMMEKGVSKVTKLKGGWAYPEPIEIDSFENISSFGEYFLHSDQRTMIMAIQMQDTYGGKDLYVSFIKPDGNWSKPKNLGLKVNTSANEKAPFLSADGVTLYFGTSGRPGYGTTDIFTTKRLDNSWTNWSKPVNMGPVINGEGFDAYYSVTTKGDYAYLTKSINKNNNIYRIKLPENVKPEPVVLVKGIVRNQKTMDPMGTSISYFDLDNNTILGSANSDDESGYYEVILPYSKLYSFFAKQDGFYALKDNLDLKEVKEYQEITRDLFLIPIEKGKKFTLNNVFFFRSQAVLLPSSRQELQELLKYLEENNSISIRIEGHTDNKGGIQANLELSQRRAEAIKSYLVDNGIPKRRIETIGFGGSNPVADNNTDEGRKKNRRVEFVITRL